MAFTKTIKIKVKSQDFADITDEIGKAIIESEVESGLCNVFSVGSTSAIIINENEPQLLEDLRKKLEKIAGSRELYQHADNAFSHIRSALLGNSQTIPIEEGKALLGNWQSVMVANLDTTSRDREVVITIVGD